jgi:hypothetical protein
MRRSSALTLTVAGALALTACSEPAPAPSAQTHGDAACAAPTFDISPNEGAPGDTVLLSADGLTETCRDNFELTENGATLPADEPTTPALAVIWNQGDVSVDLGQLQPSVEGAVTIDVQIPSDAAEGSATITAGGAEMPFVVTASNR